MIHYQLRCGAAHEFDAWFRDSASYEEQAARGLLECPQCGHRQVARALMAPAIPRKQRDRTASAARAGEGASAAAWDGAAPRRAGTGPRAPAAGAPAGVSAAGVPAGVPAGASPGAGLPAHVRVALQLLRAEVERRCDYVGTDFAAEARRIHDGDRPSRAIYGEATEAQAEALAEDGIDVSRIPWVRADA